MVKSKKIILNEIINVRGRFILGILEVVRKYKEISIQDLKAEVSTHSPYMKTTTALHLMDELTRGRNPRLKITEDGIVTLYKS